MVGLARENERGRWRESRGGGRQGRDRVGEPSCPPRIGTQHRPPPSGRGKK